MEGQARVCSRCGRRADESRYCSRCGLNLARQRELPTSAEWRSTRTKRGRPAAVRTAVALALAVLLLAGAYLLGAALGDNGEEVRVAAKKDYRDGFDKGRARGYRATYKSARRRAERAAAEAQAAAAVPSAPIPEASSASESDPDATSDGEGESDAAGEGGGSDNCDNEGLGFAKGDCPTDEEIEEINLAEEICGSPASEAEKSEEAARRAGDPDICRP